MDESVFNKPIETTTEVKSLDASISTTAPVSENEKKGIPSFIWIILVLVILFPLSAFGYLYATGGLNEFFGDKEKLVEKEEDYRTFYSQTSNISISYPSTFGQYELDVWDDVQDTLSFPDSVGPSSYLYIILAKDIVNRGAVTDGVQLERFSTENVKSDQGLLFDMITWKVQNEDLYYLETMYKGSSGERFYMKVTEGLSPDQLVYFKDLLKDIIKRCEVYSEEQEETNKYDGPYLMADLPEGWSIEENYFANIDGGDGLQDFYDMGYDGLASFQIWSKQEDGSLKPIAYFRYYEAAIPPCQHTLNCLTSCEYLKFSDSTDDEIQSLNSYFEENKDLDDNCCKELSFTDVEHYTTINFLGNKLRRVLNPKNIYQEQYRYDESLSEITECSLFGTLIEIEHFGSGSYILTIENSKETLTEEERLTLDKVLESMKIISQVDYGSVRNGTSLYFNADLPDGWDIEEDYLGYSNALSGVYITNNGKIVMGFLPSDRISGQGGCEDYISFPDDDPNNYDRVNQFESAISSDDNNAEISIRNVSDDEYKVVNVLINQLRRVGNHYYSDTISDDEYFTANCPESDLLINFENSEGKSVRYALSYDDLPYGEFDKDNQYFSITSEYSNLDESKLLILDSILESLEIIRDYKVVSLIGSWHGCSSVGSGYCERYVFKDNGVFIKFLDQGYFDPEATVVNEREVYAYSGTWDVKDDHLYLKYVKRYYNDGTFEDYVANNYELYNWVQSEDDPEIPYYWFTVIGGNSFWKFGDEDLWGDEIAKLEL